MTQRLRRGAAFAAAVLLVPAAQAQMYKCVDERGVTHYTESPRPGCKGGEVNIRPIPPLSGKTAAPAGDVARDNADFKRRQIERDNAEAKEKAQLAARSRQCARDRDQLWRFEAASQIVTGTNAAGEKTYMDDATRQRQVAELREKVAACR